MAKRTVSVYNLSQADIDTIFDEWWPWGDSGQFSGTWNGSTSGLGMSAGSVTTPIGKAVYLANVGLSATPPCRVSLQFPSTTDIGGSIPYGFIRDIVGVNGKTYPIGLLYRFTGMTRSFGAGVSGVYDPSTGVAHSNATSVTINVCASYAGYLGTDDTDFEAPYVLEVRGDSIANGTGPTKTAKMYAFMLRNLLRDTYNYRCRLRNLSIGGTTSAQWEDYRQRGITAFKKRASVIIYALGTNDSSNAITKEQHWANILAQVSEKQRFDPTALMLILAPTPNGNTGYEATLAQYRSYAAAQVAALNDPLVRYIPDTGTLYNPVTQSGTYTTDGVHLNDAGNALLYTAIANFLAANSGQVAALLPR